MTEVADPSAAASPRPRPARTGPQDLTYRLDADPRRSGSPSAEPAWLARRAPRAPSAPTRRCRSSRTACTRRTSTCAPPRSGDVAASEAPTAAAAAPASRRRRRASPPWPRSRRTGRPRSCSSDAARRAGVTRRDARRAACAATPRPPAACSPARPASPPDDKLAQLSLAAWSQGASCACPRASCSTRPIVVRWTVGAPGRAVHARTIVELGDGAEASLVEELVAVRRGRRRRPGAVHRHDRDPPRARRPARPWRASRSSGPDQVVFQQRRRRPRRGRRPPLGARAARRPPRPVAGRQRARRRPEPGRAGRDRVRRRRPAARPDVVHAPRRPRHDGPAAEQGRAARPGAELPQGADHDREERGRHRQLPRRVRHEPLEVGSRRRDPVAGDRPAGLPPGRPRVVGRADRRDAAVLPREPRHPARRGAQVHRARVPRAGRRRGSRSRMPGTGCARRSRPKWADGLAAGSRSGGAAA